METADPTTGLTGRQVEAIRKNWAVLAGSWKKYGVEFFLELFQTYPAIKAFFKMFDGMAVEDIRISPKLRAHAINFKAGINSFVDNLDDPDCLVVLIQKQATNHFRRKISVNEFKDAFKCFLNFTKNNTDLDDFTESAWVQALTVVEAVIGAHMKELEKETDGE